MAGLTLLVLAVLLAFAAPAAAHPLGEVVQNTYVWLGPEQILIDYETTIGPSITNALQPDQDRDGSVSHDEEQALLLRIAKTLQVNLEISLDGEPAPAEYFGGVLQIFQEGSRINGSEARLQFSLSPAKLSAGGHVLRMSDHNFLEGELSSLNYFVPVVRLINELRTTGKGRVLWIKYQDAAPPADQDGREDSPQPLDGQPEIQSPPGQSGPATANGREIPLPAGQADTDTDSGPDRRLTGAGLALAGGVLCLLLAAALWIAPARTRLGLTGPGRHRILAGMLTAAGCLCTAGAAWIWTAL